MKRIFITLGMIIFIGGLNPHFGQNETDVVRYISTDFSGTARVASMAGAFGALGGDLSTPLINPAGSGIYRKSEIEITPGVAFYNSDVDVLDQNFKSNEGRFIFSNLGYNYSGAPKSVKPNYFNFSLGYFRIKDFKFNSLTDYNNNNGSSMLFDFTSQAQGVAVDDLPVESPFYSNLAWQTYLIDEDSIESTTYLTQPRYEEYFPGVYQTYEVIENGSLGEIYLNGSMAIQQKVYLGLTLGFTMGNYDRKTTYKENTIDDSLLLDYHTFSYEQNTSIGGVNIKLGIIYKPEDWLRLGLAYHIPNQLHITDNWTTVLRSQFKDGTSYSEKSPDGDIEYAVRNPGKLILSAALISGFKGLLSIDVEWINYGKAEILSDQFNFNPENEIISESLRNAVNFKIGGEMWFGRYSVRAGYAFRQNAYKSITSDIPDYFNTFALGAGVLTDMNLYVNLSGNYKNGYRSQSAYSPSIAPIEQVNQSIVEILVSVGYRF
ncbi:MAG: hypothetical protein DRI54_00230 [Bacteroidetes bacterium]|nr:MAG: hypothetical protein DRI54_00230 [Bacteroidota bacterium]